MRGSIQQMPMSPPESPTLVKRKRKLAEEARTRISAAAASTAPAPAATPLTAAITGCGISRRLRTHAPVMRANSYTSRVPLLISSAMISSTSPPEQNPRPWPRITSTRMSWRRRIVTAEHLAVRSHDGAQVLLIQLQVGDVVRELDRVLRHAARCPQRDRDVANRAGELGHDVAWLGDLAGLVRPELAADPDRVAGDGRVGETTGRREFFGIDVLRPAGRLHEGSMSKGI